MGKVIYEYEFHLISLLPNVIPLIVGLGCLLAKKQKGAKLGMNIFFIIIRIVGIAVLVLGIITLSNGIKEHKELSAALKNDTAIVVQGEIENYSFEEQGNGHFVESFNVADVHFEEEYYDLPDGYSEEEPAGYFDGNGQKVLIKYVQFEGQDEDGNDETENTIVYAEQLN
jgi:hypothetical protein